VLLYPLYGVIVIAAAAAASRSDGDRRFAAWPRLPPDSDKKTPAAFAGAAGANQREECVSGVLTRRNAGPRGHGLSVARLLPRDEPQHR
jgi:hypothetical protein